MERSKLGQAELINLKKKFLRALSKYLTSCFRNNKVIEEVGREQKS